MQSLKFLLIIVFGIITGCSKSEQGVSLPGNGNVGKNSSDSPKLSYSVSFGNLKELKDKPPSDFLKDVEIGKVLRSIVPQTQFKCLDDAFNYMPDLSLETDGSLQSQLSGSHADQWTRSFISATPNGELNVILQCNSDESNYQFFTNTDLNTPTPKSILNWFYGLPSGVTTVTKSDGKSSVDIPLAKILEKELEIAPKAGLIAQNPIIKPEKDWLTSAQGEWDCRASSGAANTQVFFLFKDQLFAYQIGKSLQMISVNFIRTGSQGKGSFSEVTKDGRKAQVSIPYEISNVSASDGEMTFDFNIVGSKGDSRSSNKCTPMQKTAVAAPVQNVAPVDEVDKVTAYANGLASQLEAGSHPACGVIASNIRQFGDSGLPAEVRIRQIEAMFNRAPKICLQ